MMPQKNMKNRKGSAPSPAAEPAPSPAAVPAPSADDEKGTVPVGFLGAILSRAVRSALPLASLRADATMQVRDRGEDVESINTLACDIAANGLRTSLLVSHDGTVIGGHRRFAALSGMLSGRKFTAAGAKRETAFPALPDNLRTVPCDVLPDGLDRRTLAALVVADNGGRVEAWAGTLARLSAVRAVIAAGIGHDAGSTMLNMSRSNFTKYASIARWPSDLAKSFRAWHEACDRHGGAGSIPAAERANLVAWDTKRTNDANSAVNAATGVGKGKTPDVTLDSIRDNISSGRWNAGAAAERVDPLSAEGQKLILSACAEPGVPGDVRRLVRLLIVAHKRGTDPDVSGDAAPYVTAALVADYIKAKFVPSV